MAEISTAPTEALKTSTPKRPKIEMTRRNFLIASTLVAASGLLGSGEPQNPPPTKTESARSKESINAVDNTIFIDFAPEKKVDSIEQDSFPDNSGVIKKLLGNKWVSKLKLLSVFGINIISPGPDDPEVRKAIVQKYPEFGLVYGAIKAFSKHGKEIVEAHNVVLARFRTRSTPKMIPLQDGFDQEVISFKKDELGNSGIELFVKADPYIQALSGSHQKIVNMSFQMGRLRLSHVTKSRTFNHDSEKFSKYYEENKPKDVFRDYTGDQKTLKYIRYDPAKYELRVALNDKGVAINVLENKYTGEISHEITAVSAEEYDSLMNNLVDGANRAATTVSNVDDDKFNISGAYSKENGKESIVELVKLAKAFPDKLFIVAAGNNGDDLRGLKEEFGEAYPENLIIVGQWNKEEKQPKVLNSYIHGADIYLDNSHLGENHQGSSLSTATLSAAASILEKKGMSIDQIKNELFKFCTPISYEASSYIPIGELDENVINRFQDDKKVETANVFDLDKFTSTHQPKKSR